MININIINQIHINDKQYNREQHFEFDVCLKYVNIGVI
jgi:hypothetical protein